MATEKLIVELDAKTDGLDNKLQKSKSGLDSLDTSTKKSSMSMGEFANKAKAGALAAAAVATAVGLAINEAANFAKELKVAANRTGDSVEALQSMAFAADTVGISLEKLGDIGKDTNEKVGEFLATGGGGFQDFADVVGLSEDAARDAALEFENMSGTEVLQAMVTQMEDAGASAQQMSFALEGMASDTTDLIPLLADGGRKINGLRSEFEELNSTISEADLNKIETVGKELDKMGEVFGSESRQLIADYSEELILGIESVLLFAEKSTDTFRVVTVGLGSLLKIAQAGFTDFVNDTDTLDAVIDERARLSQEAINRLLGENPREKGKETGRQLAEGINEGIDEANSERLENGESSRQVVSHNKLDSDGLTELEAREKEWQLLLDFELDKIEELNIQKLESAEKLESDLTKIAENAQKKRENRDKKDRRDEDNKIRAQRRDTNDSLALASAANTTLLGDNKAVSKGLIVADAAVAINRQFADLPFPAAIATSAIIAANAIGALSDVDGASRGGGGIGGVTASTPIEQSIEEDNTSSLEVNERGDGESKTFTLVLEDGRSLGEVLMEDIEENTRQGR